MTKKKRSAKQLANDKRLGRMAKKRAAAARKINPKRKKRRKVAKRKKNTLRARQTRIQRARNPKRSKRYVIVALVKNQLRFFDGVRFSATLRNAAQLPLSAAKTLAGKANRKVVIASIPANARKIFGVFEGKT